MIEKLFRFTKPLGETLVELGFITTADLRKTLRYQKRLKRKNKHIPLGKMLVKRKFITLDQLRIAYAHHYQLHYLADVPLNEVNSQYLDPHFCISNKLIPLTISDKTIHVASSNPFNFRPFAEVGEQSQKAVKVSMAHGKAIMRCLQQLYPGHAMGIEKWSGSHAYASGEHPHIGGIHERENIYEAPPLKALEELILSSQEIALTEHLVTWLLLKAVKAGASDIHFEPAEGSLRIRHRIDGILYDFDERRIFDEQAAAVISRLKVMAKMTLDERQKPQDGRLLLVMKEEPHLRYDFRVASSPTINGEEIVLRLLDSRKLELGYEGLGIMGAPLKIIKEMISRPHGIIIVTGPTGSGKTTTLYTILKELNNHQKKIMTIEDPVEYRMQGIVQHQIREKADFRFADAVRAFLRHDPDIILVGEIRDKETAEASMWAALTGHLVLTTLHTNDAVSTIVRLTQMGIEPYLICSTVLLVVSQRLVRKLCPACRIKKSYPSEYLLRSGFLSNSFKAPNLNMELYSTPDKTAHIKTTPLCKKCNDTGYHDRIAIVEAMKMTEKIHEALHYNLPITEIKRTALEEGMITMQHDGLSKAYHGFTSLEEIISTTIS